MKKLIIDIIWLVGFGLLSAVVHLQFGLPCSLMFSGTLVLAWALLAAMRRRNAA
ncbi:hypothetical protein [Candidatus Symbiopectobacterium sp.]|uniref:hypothetical protein n=1 Tax=Candidatus Symbiopectobacterium sp. TaxID=2816440 RepID=UPI0025B8E228|nr:hypothetical protein [Candidatus Symbiopectobacterium sp.]